MKRTKNKNNSSNLKFLHLAIAFILGFSTAIVWILIVQNMKEEQRIEHLKQDAIRVENRFNFIYEKFVNFNLKIKNLSSGTSFGEISFKRINMEQGEAICSITVDEVNGYDATGEKFHFENQSYIDIPIQLFKGKESSYFVSDNMDGYRLVINYFGKYSDYSLINQEGDPYLVSIIPEVDFRRYSLYQNNIEKELGLSLFQFKMAGYINIR